MKNLNEKIKKYGVYVGLLAILLIMLAIMGNLALGTPDIGEAKEPSPFAVSLVKTFPVLGDVAKDLMPDSAIAGYLKKEEAKENGSEGDGNNTPAAGKPNQYYYSKDEIDKEKYKYIDDTTYTGSRNVSLENFSEPFAKSENYISNKVLLEGLDEEVKENVFKTAEAFVTDLFTTDYHALEVSSEAYMGKLMSYYQPNSAMYTPDGTLLKNEYLVGRYIQWLIENKVQTEGTFKSDNSLIYADGRFMYVRGELDLSSYSCEDEDGVSECLPMMINMKDGGKYIFEVGIAYYGDWYKDILTSPYCVKYYNVVKVEE